MPVALPPFEETKLAAAETRHKADYLSAYSICLNFERRMGELANGEGNQAVIYARVLGCLILHAPSLTACHEIATVIHSCRMNDEALYALGASFVQYFISPFKKSKGCTPASSDHLSHPSFDVEPEKTDGKNYGGSEGPQGCEETGSSSRCFSVVVTGLYDVQVEQVDFSSFGINREELDRAGTLYTECAHIVPESTYFNVSSTTGSSAKMDYSATVLAVLKHFCYDVENLRGPKVHSLHNVMTMQHDVHVSFDRLELYFENIEKNCYRVETFTPSRCFMQQVRKKITFTTTVPVNLPVPDPKFLALHAACAKVAHLSGAAKYIDKFDQDVDDLNVLTPDGGSFDVLSHAIMRTLPGSSI